MEAKKYSETFFNTKGIAQQSPGLRQGSVRKANSVLVVLVSPGKTPPENHNPVKVAALSLTPCFSGVSGASPRVRTVSTVFLSTSRSPETVKTVELPEASPTTSLKRGVNERRLPPAENPRGIPSLWPLSPRKRARAPARPVPWINEIKRVRCSPSYFEVWIGEQLHQFRNCWLGVVPHILVLECADHCEPERHRGLLIGQNRPKCRQNLASVNRQHRDDSRRRVGVTWAVHQLDECGHSSLSLRTERDERVDGAGRPTYLHHGISVDKSQRVKACLDFKPPTGRLVTNPRQQVRNRIRSDLPDRLINFVWGPVRIPIPVHPRTQPLPAILRFPFGPGQQNDPANHDSEANQGQINASLSHGPTMMPPLGRQASRNAPNAERTASPRYSRLAIGVTLVAQTASLLYRRLPTGRQTPPRNASNNSRLNKMKLHPTTHSSTTRRTTTAAKRIWVRKRTPRWWLLQSTQTRRPSEERTGD